MPLPKYALRIARLPQVFELLAAHPDGLALDDLAACVGVPADELREDLLAFFTADLGGMLGLSRPPVLEFVGHDGYEVDPNVAEVVRIIDERPAEELGVEYVDASELALVYTAAAALLDASPDDADLAGAVDVLTETMFGAQLALDEPSDWQRPLAPLQQAARERKRVRIVYSRAWLPGVGEREIEPYRLVQTRRGWEVDAGPPDAAGVLRTYLLSNVRDVEVLESTFDSPDDLEARLEAQRATTTARVRMPHAARWAADFYAERVTVVDEDEDEDSVTLDLAMLPPLAGRVGLQVLAAGPDTVVLSPAQLYTAGQDLAATLLAHHRRE